VDRLRTHDWLRLAFWFPLWVFCFVLGLRTLGIGAQLSNVMIGAPESAETAPRVLGFRPYL
jgi:hypothetical protein